MSFNNSARFPLGIAFGALGGPMYQTSLVTADSGREWRNADWSVSRCKWDVGMRAMKKVDTDDLIAFFRVVKARLHGFRFRDWSDYQVGEGEGVIIQNPDGTLQLAKKYVSGDLTEYRPITTPVLGTVTMSGFRLDDLVSSSAQFGGSFGGISDVFGDHYHGAVGLPPPPPRNFVKEYL